TGSPEDPARLGATAWTGELHGTVDRFLGRGHPPQCGTTRGVVHTPSTPNTHGMDRKFTWFHLFLPTGDPFYGARTDARRTCAGPCEPKGIRHRDHLPRPADRCGGPDRGRGRHLRTG